MAPTKISRVWFDTLVDDTGDLTSGTPVDKAFVDAILDDVDDLFAGNLEVGGTVTAPGGLGTTPLNASQLTSGEIPDALLSDNVQLKPIPAADLPAHAPRHAAAGADPLPVTSLAGYPGGATTFLRDDGTFAVVPVPAPGPPLAHKTTHEPGGSDPITALDGSVLTTGTIDDARLSSDVLQHTGGYPGTPPQNFLRSDGTFAVPTGPAPYFDLAEGVPVDPAANIARLYAIDVNGYTQVEIRDGAAKVVRLASDNVLVAKVKESGGVIRGACVYLSGASGANPEVKLAKADDLATMPSIGLTLDAGGNNASVRVLLGGTLALLNTLAFAEGDRVYVSSTTAGALSTTPPVAPAFTQRLGFVTRVHASQGEILVQSTAVAGPPRFHAETHEAAGDDPVDVTSLAGFPGGTTNFLRADGSFATPAAGAPTAHAATHAPGGSDVFPMAATNRLLGRATAAAGPVEELIIGENLRLTGTTLSATSRGSVLVNYTFSNVQAEPPGAAQARLNATFPYTAVTKIWLWNITSDGQDVYRGLLLVSVGSNLLMQDKNDHTQYAVFTVTAPPIDKTTYVEFTVVHHSHGNSIGGGQEVILQNISGAATPLVHHTTHEPGGSDAITVLNASILTGTVPDAALAVNVLRHTAGYPGGTTNFLRADGTFAAPAGGGGAHAATHSSGGADPVTVTALAGYPGGTANFLRADGTFAAPPGGTVPGLHASTHDTGGGDALTALSAGILTSGTLPEARLPALTGDVTSTVNTAATTIAANAVTYAKLQDVSASRLLGRGSAGAGDPQELSVGSGLTISGTTLGMIGVLPHALTHMSGSSDPMPVNEPAATGSLRTLGTTATSACAGNDARLSDTRTPTAHATAHNTGGGDALTALSAAILTTGTLPAARLPALTGDVTSTVNTVATTIANLAVSTAKVADGAITYAKMQDVSAVSRLLGRGAGSGAGDPQEITLGTGLSMTTTTLNASGVVPADHASEHEPGGGDAMAVNAAAGTGSLRTLGTSATSACAGNDSRLTNSRTPTAHASTHAAGGSDPLIRLGVLGFIIDGGGSVITTGVKGFLEIPFDCTITGVTLLSTDAAATAGSIVVDLWKDTYANYPPVVGDSITASAKPTLSSANKSKDSTLTGWTTSVTAGDIIGVSVTSATTVTRVLLSLKVQAT